MAKGNNSMQAHTKNLFKMVATLATIAVVSAFVLSSVYQITKEPIAKAKDAKELSAISQVVGEFDNNPFAEKMTIITSDKKDKLTFFPARKNGVINSFAIKTYSNSGFGGKIEMIAGFYIDGSIKSFKITSHQETPGLGSKADEAKFKQQFDGFNPKKHKFKVKQDGGDIDAVTAATITSRAVIDAITRALDAYNNFNAGK